MFGLLDFFYFEFLKVNIEDVKFERYNVYVCSKNMDRYLF